MEEEPANASTGMDDLKTLIMGLDKKLDNIDTKMEGRLKHQRPLQ